MIPVPVASGDRVLIHLLSRGDPDGWSGGVSDQDLISSMCGIGRTHIPRVLKPLMEQDLIVEDTGRVPDKPRRVKVYSLTQDGAAQARDALARANEVKVYWTDETGRRRSARAVECLDQINSHLRELSMAVLPASLFLSLPIEDLSWNDIMWTSASIRDIHGEGPCIPEGWRPFTFRGGFKGMSFERELLEELDRKISGGMVAITGGEDAGKEELIELWSRSRSRKALWLEKGDDDGVCPEGGPWDLIVLVGGADPDISELLIEGAEVKDLRDSHWPREFRSIDLIMTTSADVDLSGPVVKAHGLSGEYFVSRCLERGLPEPLAREISMSTGSSPKALKYLLRCDPRELEQIRDMDSEEAVLKILLELKKL